MSRDGHVTVRVINLLGQQVRELVSGVRGAGEHLVVWDGKNDSGRGVSSGVYLCRMRTHDVAETIKMVLLR
jgi:flagellar hook assembly protein FlgD